MNRAPFDPAGLQLVPRWMPVVVAIVTIIGSSGATYATFGMRLTDLESRTDRMDADQTRRREEYEQFKQHLASQLQSLEDGQQTQSATLGRIASRLGLVP